MTFNKGKETTISAVDNNETTIKTTTTASSLNKGNDGVSTNDADGHFHPQGVRGFSFYAHKFSIID